VTLQLAWLWLFNEIDPRRQHGADIWEPVLSAPAPEQLYLEYYYACRQHQSCEFGDRRLRYVTDFVQLPDKPLLARV
jgi:hypothetical protein